MPSRQKMASCRCPGRLENAMTPNAAAVASPPMTTGRAAAPTARAWSTPVCRTAKKTCIAYSSAIPSRTPPNPSVMANTPPGIRLTPAVASTSTVIGTRKTKSASRVRRNQT